MPSSLELRVRGYSQYDFAEFLFIEHSNDHLIKENAKLVTLKDLESGGTETPKEHGLGLYQCALVPGKGDTSRIARNRSRGTHSPQGFGFTEFVHVSRLYYVITPHPGEATSYTLMQILGILFLRKYEMRRL